MSLFYLALIPVVFLGYLVFADNSFKRKDPKYAIPTPTRVVEIGTLIATARPQRFGQTATPNPPVATVPPDGVVLRPSPEVVGSPDLVYVVVTATITPTPTMTPNPYGTLHMTASALWHAFTVTPALATMWARPLYDMATGDCFQNCGFITSTPSPLIYNP